MLNGLTYHVIAVIGCHSDHVIGNMSYWTLIVNDSLITVLGACS